MAEEVIFVGPAATRVVVQVPDAPKKSEVKKKAEAKKKK